MKTDRSNENHNDEEEFADLSIAECRLTEAEPVAASKKKKSRKKKPNNPTGASSTVNDDFQFSRDRNKIIKVVEIQGKGRSLVASCIIPAGTVFFNERPVAVIAHKKELCFRY